MALALVTCSIAWIVLAWDPSGSAAQEKTATPGDAPGFAYAAPAFIKELDTRFPAQPPVPPSPPRYGGVVNFPGVVRALDWKGGYGPEFVLVWERLREWEGMWNFSEVKGMGVMGKSVVK